MLVNATPQAQTFTDPAFKRQPLLLHPVQAFSQRSGGAHVDVPEGTGTFTVPARTTAVFIVPASDDATS